MDKMKKRRKVYIALIVILFIPIFCVWQNNGISVSNIEFRSSRVSQNLNGFKILQISDLHNKKFGNNQKRLVNAVKKQAPEIIVITGDLIDGKRTNINTAMSLIDNLIDIAPVYFVTGNHEAWSGQYDRLQGLLSDAGVTILDNDSVNINYNGSAVNVIGLIDPAFSGSPTYEIVENINDNMSLDENVLNILLAHRPELFRFYVESDVDLVFSGHAHGGQFRIPFLGGIIAPDQGFFPEYTSGTYKLDDTTMVVSRGLGNSIIPIRVFNRPEIVSVTLGDL